jgi:hypothetical protein
MNTAGIATRGWKGNAGYARPIALALSRPRLLFPALRIFAEALRSFFYPQFENALLGRRPVVNVDHPLDPAVPFDAGYIEKYLEFIKLWMGSFYRIGRLYGGAADPGLVGFAHSIRSLYAEAGSLYKVVHTTTTRPSKNYNLRFAFIHALDPHLNCVPSLHVILVLANWLLTVDLVGRLGADRARGLGEAEVARWMDELWAEALAITESVLFVKQHSVNCVGASLYYLKRRFPAFDGERAEAFVAQLFASKDGSLPRAAELRSVILGVCASLDAAYARDPAQGWRRPLLDFIDSFAG